MKKLLLFLFSGILSVILYEYFLQFSPFKFGLSPVKYDDKIGMWHKENYSDYKIDKCYKGKYFLDNKGLPKNILNYNKNLKDIIIIGDSYVEAFMVENTNIVHNSLSKLYKDKFNFLNYGLSGTSPTQQYVILKEKVDLNRTSVVLQFINEGDLMDTDAKYFDNLARPKVHLDFIDFDNFKIIPPRTETIYDKLGDLLGNFELYTYIKKGIYFFRNNFSIKEETILFKEQKNEEINLSKNWLNLKGAIYQTKILLNQNNIKYKIILDFKDDTKNQIIANFLNEKNIDFIDIVRDVDFELKSFECDGHWNDETHRNIANTIFKNNFLK